MKAKSAAQELLTSRFQQLVKDRKAQNEMPEELRRAVFKTLEQVDEVDDVTELFNGDCAPTKPAFFDRIEPAEAPKKEKG